MATAVKYLIETRFGSFYANIVRKNPKVLLVTIPAFLDVVTEGRTLAEAKKYAREVIELQCLAALDDNKLIIDDLHRAHGKFARSGTLTVSA
jgi:predicted RNase H-like HicB family nuclease